ncbi:hypothetical protein [Actinoallomurus bryophytorum]
MDFLARTPSGDLSASERARLMRKPLRVLVPLAAALPLAFPAVANAQSGASTYQAMLNPLNHSTGSGRITVELHGDQATVTEHFSGLASTFMKKPYPHVQHIHINGNGKCPTTSADTNNDGVVNTAEGQPAYGPIGTSLTTTGDTSAKSGTALTRFPAGADGTYHRTFTLDSATMSSLTSGKGVVVVHGLDPTTLSKKAQGEKSELVPTLPLAATSPVLCGPLTAMPNSGASTGGGSTSGVQNLALFGLGGGLLAAAAGAVVVRRRAGSVG